MDIVDIYYTNLDVEPPIRDEYWKNCSFSINKRTDLPKNQQIYDGSDYRFMINFLGEIPQNQLPGKIIPLNTIRDIVSIRERTLMIIIDKQPIKFRIEFESDESIMKWLKLLVNLIPCFDWDKKQNEPTNRPYVIHNEIVWNTYHHQPIESSRQSNQNDEQDDQNDQDFSDDSDSDNDTDSDSDTDSDDSSDDTIVNSESDTLTENESTDSDK